MSLLSRAAKGHVSQLKNSEISVSLAQTLLQLAAESYHTLAIN